MGLELQGQSAQLEHASRPRMGIAQRPEQHNADDARRPGDRPTPRRALDHHDGEVRVLAATVVHAADGRPDHVVAIGELDDGSRLTAPLVVAADEERTAAILSAIALAAAVIF